MFPALLNAATVTMPTIDLTGVDFGGILKIVTDLIPVILPVVVAFIALRKGISFLYNSLRGA